MLSSKKRTNFSFLCAVQFTTDHNLSSYLIMHCAIIYYKNDVTESMMVLHGT